MAHAHDRRSNGWKGIYYNSGRHPASRLEDTSLYVARKKIMNAKKKVRVWQLPILISNHRVLL